MSNSPTAPGSIQPSPSRPCSKPATYIDFVNPLLWVLLTNLAFSLGPSILHASHAAANTQDLMIAFGVVLFLISKLVEAVAVADLLASSPSLSSRTVTTAILLAAHVGLLAPMFISELSLFARFTFMLWSVTLGAFFGICLGVGRSEFGSKKVQRVIKAD
ncbi:hypothetical protein V1517DRAFT_307010 [Lipomyces orientalis]|uniref:Uncharacterized protein n=1 Tax=Lipomyces orientalis TaxID=1233043 RepID=A0ACC3TQQ5_9ASCO